MYLNRITDVEASVFPHEKTVYYCIAFVSFNAFVQILVGVFLIVWKSEITTKIIGLLVTGVIEAVLCGFTTFMPLFL